ncbi:unnamed protein product [Phytophthora fragariaefolia]|uniref:Unnamed protein product n=1 Tax=Phytophthora fragariaefolia TaxID=1490495 RepID=A0A9W7D3A4_9STRA|nr:unnamed protein product [Phytophthora fragariaefolia]
MFCHVINCLISFSIFPIPMVPDEAQVASLVSAVVVLRNNPSVGALPHIASSVSQCLDYSAVIPLARACAFGSLRLVRRVWGISEEFAASDGDPRQRRPSCWSPLQFLQSDRHYYRAQFSQGVIEAVRRGDLDMIRWLFAQLSGCEAGVQAVETAAAAGDLRILQFFLDNESAAEAAAEAGTSNHVQWGGGDLAIAAESGHADVVRWLFERKGSVERDWGRFMAAVVRSGDFVLLQWMLARGYAERQLAPPTMDDAAWGGHLYMLKWLYLNGYVHHASFALEYAARNGYLEIVEWLVRNHPVGNASRALDAAARENRLDIVRWLLGHNLGRGAKSGMHQAAIRGYLEVASYLHEQGFHGLAGVSCGTMLRAAGRGFFDVVRWLDSEFASDPQTHLYRDLRPYSLTLLADEPSTAIDAAATSGHLEVLKYLQRVDDRMQEEGFSGSRPTDTHDAIDGAAAGNFLDVVEWLSKHRSGIGTTAAMDGAAANGHLTMVQWLHTCRTEGCTNAAMDGAAANGHLEIVKWLHYHRSEGCTTAAMDEAARHGHLDVVQWLHCNRTEGCSAEAMNNAAGAGLLEMVMWLDRYRNEGCTSRAMDAAASGGFFEVLLFLKSQRIEGCSRDAAFEAQRKKHANVLAWLEENYPDAPAPQRRCLLFQLFAATAVSDALTGNSVVGFRVQCGLEAQASGSLGIQLLTSIPFRQLCLSISLLRNSQLYAANTALSQRAVTHDSVVFVPASIHTPGMSTRLSRSRHAADASVAEKEATLTTGLMVVLREQPGVAALQHVVHALDDLVDVSWQWNIARACALSGETLSRRDGGARRLVARIVARRPLASMDTFYRQAQLSAGLVNAAQCKNSVLVSWLLENIVTERFTIDSHSAIFKAAEAAASKGYLDILEHVLRHDKRGVSTKPAMLAAARGNNLNVLEWLHKHFAKSSALSDCANALLEVAAGNGNAKMASWLVEVVGADCLRLSVASAAQNAISGGHLKMITSLGIIASSVDGPLSLDEAAGKGYLQAVQWGVKHGGVCSTEAMDTAASNGYLRIVQWLHHNCAAECTIRAMDSAASHGHLDVVEWLHEHRDEGCSTEAMDGAASHGHLDVVKWLHSNRSEGCTVAAMNGAARENHILVLQWLHNHRSEGCAQEAMDGAAAHGNIAVMRWLITHCSESCNYSQSALETAAANGRLDAVQLLYKQLSQHIMSEWVACEALDCAASGGHLGVVKWLHERRPEIGSCTTAALDGAASNGHLQMVKWLHANRREGGTYHAMDGAAAGGHLEVLMFLYSHRSDGCTSDAAVNAAMNDHVEVVQWLLQRYPQQISHDRVRKFAAKCNFSLLDQSNRNQIPP